VVISADEGEVGEVSLEYLPERSLARRVSVVISADEGEIGEQCLQKGVTCRAPALGKQESWETWVDVVSPRFDSANRGLRPRPQVMSDFG
jgi:hypothetical protein